ncbi:MAG: hypothetical protein A2X67_00615 [Ignavibacteria bacterium GWA2_55_11]|nr:MAG: hypothetical protein A2X67_00615 [Ignavibacteria bacterium GWA2_55_11]OGU45713.1 MAG: hypothetical protein A2X68_04775 [Ignavibacteria bacterium GWC2_56_12]OGU72075.1 MAG: hypothetical protein A3G43_09155 [Ignavibacteria bacterium RIFCSPLOWO2_12_FULL_56_21]
MEYSSHGELTMSIEAILLVVLIAAVGILVVRMMRGPQTSAASGESMILVQQQLDSLRGEVQNSLRSTTDSVSAALRTTQESMMQSLIVTSQQMGQQLATVNNQLQSVTSQLQTNTGQMGSRLDNAAKVIQDVQKQLGELGKATEEIKEMGKNVSDLQDLLRAPKMRGGLGELLLEDLLRQVLPVTAFKTQYKFKSGEKVDAIIQTAGGIVPVDSKFPLENFRKMMEAKTDQDRNAAARLFRTDVKKHVDDIAKKYIVPDEGTFDFALMYIPAENIYYETIIKDDKFEGEDGLYAYAAAKHVVPVSPNSFYAHLRVIALGLKGLQVEASAKEIISNLSRLGGELKKFRDHFDTLDTHLTNAKNTYDRADKQLASFEDKLGSVQQVQPGQKPPQLDAFKEPQ